jgi:hypothetical protein
MLTVYLRAEWYDEFMLTLAKEGTGPFTSFWPHHHCKAMTDSTGDGYRY